MIPPDDRGIKALARDRFGRFADAYVTSPSHSSGPDLDLLLEMAQPEAHWRVLDVGTGGGHAALLLAPHVARVTAADLAPEMLEAARAHIAGRGAANVEFAVADAEHLPFEAASFDLVTCRNAAHHFPDASAFMREAVRVLRPGGRLVVQDQCVPNNEEAAGFIRSIESRRDPSHARALSEVEWRALFGAAGFEVERTEHVTKRHGLSHWAHMQACDTATKAELLHSLQEAPPAAREWMKPRSEDGDWSFIIDLILIAGRFQTTPEPA